jgi:hypothetical protein
MNINVFGEYAKSILSYKGYTQIGIKLSLSRRHQNQKISDLRSSSYKGSNVQKNLSRYCPFKMPRSRFARLGCYVHINTYITNLRKTRWLMMTQSCGWKDRVVLIKRDREESLQSSFVYFLE